MTMDDTVPVQTIHHGWIVVLNTKVLVEGLRSNAEAWLWVDKNTDEGRADIDRHNRIRDAFNGSEQWVF